jgi:hypothetical protein
MFDQDGLFILTFKFIERLIFGKKYKNKMNVIFFSQSINISEDVKKNSLKL